MRPSKWLEFWSERRPDDASPRIQLAELQDDERKRLVALRSAMRAFPGIARIDDGPWKLGRSVDLLIRLHAIRAIFVTWSEFAFGGVRPDARRKAFDALAVPLAKLDEGLPDFYNLNMMSSDYGVSVSQRAVEAARRAVSLVEAIDCLEFRKLPFDKDERYSQFLDTLSFSGPNGHDERGRWRAAQSAAIGADCATLRENMATLEELALAPLWPNSSSATLETNLTLGLGAKNTRELGVHIEKWLRERKDGPLLLNLEVEKVRERIVRTASLPQSFWESRPPADTLHAFEYCLQGDLQNPS